MTICIFMKEGTQMIFSSTGLRETAYDEDDYRGFFYKVANNHILNFEGHKVEIDISYICIAVKELSFSVMTKFSPKILTKIRETNCSKAIIESVKDYPFSVYMKHRRVSRQDYDYYESLYERLSNDRIKKCRNKELYDRICILTDLKQFNQFCLRLIDKNFLLYETDYVPRIFSLMSTARLSITEMSEETSWIKIKKIRTLLTAIIVIVPVVADEFIDEFLRLENVNLSSSNVNEIAFLYQVCTFDIKSFTRLILTLIKYGLRMNVPIVQEKLTYNWKFDRYFHKCSFIEGIENAINNWIYPCLEVYIKLLEIYPEHTSKFKDFVTTFTAKKTDCSFYITEPSASINLPLLYQLMKYFEITNFNAVYKEIERLQYIDSMSHIADVVVKHPTSIASKVFRTKKIFINILSFLNKYTEDEGFISSIFNKGFFLK